MVNLYLVNDMNSSIPTSYFQYFLARHACIGGYFCPSGTVNPADDPDLLCPAGSMCAEGSSIPQPCPLGSYQDSAGQSVCIECPAGYSCGDVSGTVSPRICPVGNRCPLGSSEPLPCALGTYQDVVGSGVCKSCPAGYYCDVTSGTIRPRSCMAGFKCPVGSIIPTPCLAGSYQFQNSSADCENCTIGYYCNVVGETLQKIICPPGYACPSGSSHPLICPVGTFQNNEGDGSCLECPDGFYCSKGKTITPLPCLSGFMCPAGSITPTKCPLGYYQNLNMSSSCSVCPGGKQLFIMSSFVIKLI